jgi:tetratricopeptide (TPR) repeat protein
MTIRMRMLCIVAVVGAMAACGRVSEHEVDGRLAVLQESALAQPDSIDGWIVLGEASLRLWHDTDDPTVSTTAMVASQAATALDPSDLRAMSLHAKVRAARSEFMQAAKILHGMLRINHNNATTWGRLGDAYLELGHYRSADSCYFVMYEMDPGFESLRRIAGVTALLRDYSEAVGYIDRAIERSEAELVPEHALAEALAERGALFFSRGHVEGAKRSVSSALDLHPDLLPAWELRGRILTAENDVIAALSAFETLVSLSPHPRYKSMLARAYDHADRHREADSLVTVAKSGFESWWEPYAPIVVRDRIEFLLEWHIDPVLALELARRETRHRKDIRGYELLARAYLANGHAELAWSSLAFALRRGAQEPRLYHLAAVIAKAAGKTDKYETFSARARKSNPLIETLYGSM